MKNKVKCILLSSTLLLYFSLFSLQAQETITATGGNSKSSAGSLAYSIGQVFYMPIPGNIFYVVPGVQQPYEISVLSGIEETGLEELMISAYPNPAGDFMTLRMESDQLIYSRSIYYSLYDIHGKLITNENIISDLTMIPMENLTPGIYFLKIMATDGKIAQKSIRTFKIIKTK